MTRADTKLRKRLFVNLDGTGQAQYTRAGAMIDGKQSSVPVSNVARIGRATLLEDEENGFEQVVYYQAGIGADTEQTILQKGVSAGWGAGLVSNVRSAYGFICNNYDYGDEIYITGFSRGAYTARSVAGLIGKVGLLTKTGLKLFYESFECYQYSNRYKDKHRDCPVSEAAGTTRIHYPNTNPPQPIKIRAVGVWDTVGGLDDDEYSWHDVTLGTHIEHAYHALSLDENRGYYGPTLWECPNIPRSLQSLEQCWMAGDHSNIGGSWDDQQLADIALAWIMSRFDALGVKFDQNYLYNEYQKFHGYVKNIGPRAGYPANMSPRQWGEGRSKEVWLFPANRLYGGTVQRTPGEYPKLQNTNETMHPVVRYRHFCKKQGHLGPEDKTAYNPKSLNNWTWPLGQKDGRIGAGQRTTSVGPLKYTRIGANKSNLQIPESPMGKFELQLLALYDQDPALQKSDGGVWEKVMGGIDGPPKYIKDALSEMARPAVNPYDFATQLSEAIYIGQRPAVTWDESLFRDYAALGSVLRVGSWNGNGITRSGGSAPFSSLGSIHHSSKVNSIEFYYDANVKAISGLILYHDDNIHERYSWGEENFEISTLSLAEDEKVVKIETKAFKPPGHELLIQGVKLTTTEGQVWKSSEYDKLSNDMVLSEDAPGREWYLTGFYGALGDLVERLGPIWGKQDKKSSG